jgi:signal transduction histidine kinase
LNISLRWRLLLVTGAIAAAALAGVAAFSSRIATIEIQRSMAREAPAQSYRAFERPLIDFWQRHRNWDGVQTELEHLASGLGRNVLLASPENRILAAWPRAFLTAELSKEPDGGLRIRTAGEDLEIRGGPQLELFDSGNSLAILYVLPTESLAGAPHGSRTRVNRSLGIAALFALSAAILATVLLSRYILQPIQALTVAARNLTEGDLKQRVAVTTHDELGRLAETFNSMADRLGQTEKLRQNMVNDISHELRTPLTRLRCHVESVEDGMVPPDSQTFSSLHQQILLLERLVDDLQDLALSDAGQFRLSLGPTALEPLLKGIVESMGPAVRIECEPGLPPVTADERRVRQIVDNLLSNALRYAPEGTPILIAVHKNHKELEVAVKDSGPGIPPDQLALVFERFYRADSSRTRSTGGTGLGLAIARQLVQAHGGRLWAVSQPGHGAEFHFTLPILTTAS